MQIFDMKNEIERGPERIPTKEEVMGIIIRHVESSGGLTIIRELNYTDGLHLLDIRTEGTKPGETIEYLYTKKGLLPTGVPTAETSIEVSYYQDGEIYFGARVAVYNAQTGEWNEEV